MNCLAVPRAVTEPDTGGGGCTKELDHYYNFESVIYTIGLHKQNITAVLQKHYEKSKI
jgi:hypothetical protein